MPFTSPILGFDKTSVLSNPSKLVQRSQVIFLAVGAIKNKKIIGALEWLERFAYRKADRIVAVTNAFKVHIVALGGCESKTDVISGSHGPPWEPIHWLPRQDRYAFPRRTVGTRKRGIKTGSGISIEPEKAKELAAAITALADAPEKCAAMGEAGKACVSAEFDRRALARRFEEVWVSVV